MKKVILCTLGCLAFLSACKPPIPSDTVPADDIEQRYSVFYTEEKNDFVSGSYEAKTTHVRADLYNINRNLRPGGGAQFFHNGELMKSDTYMGEQRKIQGLVTQHRFEYVDHRGRSFKNRVTLVPIYLPTVIRGSISQAYNATMNWNGAPVGENETVALHVVQRKANGSGYIVDRVTSNRVGATSLFISAEFLQQYQSGVDVDIYLSRSSKIKLQQATDKAGGSLETIYYSQIGSTRIDP